MIKDKGDIHQAFSPSEGLVDELVDRKSVV